MGDNKFEKYDLLYTEVEDPGLYLVRIPFEQENHSEPIEQGEAGILFTGHSETNQEVLQSSGIFFPIDKVKEIVEKGCRGSSFKPTSRFEEQSSVCIWCNKEINAQDSIIKFQKTKIHNIFTDSVPTFHSSCFLEFRYHMKEILDQPEIISHVM